MVRLTDRPDMTLDVYRGRKTAKQQQCCKQPDALLPKAIRQWTNVHHNRPIELTGAPKGIK